ncbi:molybdopterin-dependent oxidoreductase [Mycolicibacterium parafortuitum]|uniref:Oxidoreductase [Nocardia brasiliensis ATCC] n=1 Tax=Mycolicibacterium parafortuitum TaxID=39692 RepID=A0A375YJ06_MYCPF|nr:molybdopterin-dependent oxidoreductase [Mycolicibacterium parafortuitum]ORB32398.1 oxidoreductase [Mycolicibacterium parafortuitum]SRX81106.1 oxidoreductase [Nocardia brasiliensis ATCC] [Mycolicibacterium parafortuitum]
MTPLGTKALGGVAAAAVAVGVAQLVGAAFGPEADVRTAVGSAVIDNTPGPVKEWAIATFGTADKLFLTVMVLLAIAAIAALAGIAESRRRPIGSTIIVVAGGVGCAAVLSRAGAGPADVIPTVIGAACGVAALRLLTSHRLDDQTPERGTDPDRRRSLVTLGLFGVGVAGGVVGVVISRLASSVAGDRDAYALPRIAEPAPPIPPTVQPEGVALPSFVTSNADFYRIDTALTVPQLSRADWRLRIHGMVDREITLSYSDLDRFEVVEQAVTLTCVSNPVGGELISNAVWTGYRVADILAGAGVHADADMVLSRSVDGWTAGTPVEALTAGDALLAIGMNGEPLPVEHGYPARLVVPGLYGYVSATKWVTGLELTRFDRAEAYWTRLGWSARGPIKTESRIDVPRSGQDVAVGPVTFGGVAWAQRRGIRDVEVQIEGPGGTTAWQRATLGQSYSDDTWRLWSFPWEATETGMHTITVRATDNSGYTQTPDRADPVPDGATGWHSVTFAVK